jgi:hypothetical protein
MNAEKLNYGGSISNWDKDIKNVLIHHIGMRYEINSCKQRKVRHYKLFYILCELPQAFRRKVFRERGGWWGKQAVNILFQIHYYSSFWNVV